MVYLRTTHHSSWKPLGMRRTKKQIYIKQQKVLNFHFETYQKTERSYNYKWYVTLSNAAEVWKSRQLSESAWRWEREDSRKHNINSLPRCEDSFQMQKMKLRLELQGTGLSLRRLPLENSCQGDESNSSGISKTITPKTHPTIEGLPWWTFKKIISLWFLAK